MTLKTEKFQLKKEIRDLKKGVGSNNQDIENDDQSYEIKEL